MIKKHSVIYTWIISYILLFILIILSSFSMEKLASRQLVEEYKEISGTLQRQAGESMQFYFEKMQNQAIEFCSDDLVTGFALSANPYGSNYHSVIALKKKLNSLMLTTEKETDLFLYLHNIDKAVSQDTIYNNTLFYEKINESIKLDKTEFDTILNEKFHNEIQTFDAPNGKGKTVAMLTSVPIAGVSSKGMFMQILDNQILQNLLENKTVLTDSTLLLLDEKNQVICSSGDDEVMEDIEFLDVSQIKNQEYEIADSTYWVTWEWIHNGDWKLVTLVPTSLIEQKTNWVSQITLPILCVALLVGVLISGCGICLNYLPLRKLSQTLSGKVKKIDSKNEFERLECAFQGMHSELESMQLLQNMQADQLKTEFLRSCLGNSIDLDESSMLKIIENLGVKLNNDSFITGLFNMDTDDNGQTVSTSEMEGVLRQLFSGSEFVRFGSFSLLTKNEMLVLLFYIKESTSQDALISLCKEKVQLLSEKLHLPLIYAFSALHKGYSEIHLAYLEACELMDYKQSRIEMREQEAEDVEALPQYGQIRYSLAQEELLMRYVLAGNSQDALDLLKIIYNHNFVEQVLPLSVGCCLMEYIVSGIMKALSEAGYLNENMIKKINRVMDCFHKSNSQNSFREWMDVLILDVTDYCREKKNQKGKTKDLPVDKIMRCVEEHFREDDFNVSKAAEYMNVNMTYLSRYFKEHTGIGLLNYINGVRIDYAKQLLSHGKMTVSEAARLAGFENQNTFIRLFKKFEGKTPGIFQGESKSEQI